jgi:hypothetical protein
MPGLAAQREQLGATASSDAVIIHTGRCLVIAALMLESRRDRGSGNRWGRDGKAKGVYPQLLAPLGRIEQGEARMMLRALVPNVELFDISGGLRLQSPIRDGQLCLHNAISRASWSGRGGQGLAGLNEWVVDSVL